MTLLIDYMEKLQLFQDAYEKACSFLSPHITYDMCKKISRFDRGMDPDIFNFKIYLQRSYVRYKRIIQASHKNNATWLDVGALFPAFPIALAVLGYEVTVVEDFSFYPSEIEDSYKIIHDKFGITFINKNFSNKDFILEKKFDYISVLGVIEHLPYSPKIVLQNCIHNLSDEGTFFLDVPNLNYIGNIMRFVRGNHIQCPIDLLYESDIPFVGHHREYTIKDLLYILTQTGFQLRDVQFFNYSSRYTLKTFIAHSLFYLLQYIPQFRELIYIRCTKDSIEDEK